VSDPKLVVETVESYPVLSGYYRLEGRLLGDRALSETEGLPFRWGHQASYEGYVSCGEVSCVYTQMRLVKATPTAVPGATFNLDLYSGMLRGALGVTADGGTVDCAAGLKLTSPNEDEKRAVTLRFSAEITCEQFVDKFVTSGSTAGKQRITFEFVSAPPINELLVKSVTLLP
jgi:hypothetical protein